MEYFPDEPIIVPESFSTYTYFKWEIEQFADWLANPATAPQSLASPAFSLENNQSSIFNLELFPNGKKEENAGYLSLFVRSQATNETSHKLKYTFALINENGKKKKLCRLNEFSLFKPNKGLGFFRYISHEEIKQIGVLVNGALTISCEVIYRKQKLDF